jgi:MYXO-CTERM domain-containing protein
MKKLSALTSLLLIPGSIAFASSFTPSFTSFGTLAGATFGGSGNPNNAVAITTITHGTDTITLGLQAQQRYANPPLANNGAGVFYATPGANYGNPANPADQTYSTLLGAKWNFDLYGSLVDNSGSTYSFVLLYGPDGSPLVSIPLGSTHVSGTQQDSENLNFPIFGTAIGFNPNAAGQYDFELEAFDASGNLLGDSAIIVNVTPDVASTGGLLGLGLLALAGCGFTQRRRQMA